MQSGSPVVRVKGLLVMGYGCGHGGCFPLRGTAAEVRNQTDTERVAGVQAFHRAQIPGHFSQTLPEADAQEVHGQRMSVEISFSSCGLKHLQMIHCHLQYFRFLQLGRSLFLKSCWHQTTQL